MQVVRGRAVQAKGVAGAKVLRWERSVSSGKAVWLQQGAAWMAPGLSSTLGP